METSEAQSILRQLGLKGLIDRSQAHDCENLTLLESTIQETAAALPRCRDAEARSTVLRLMRFAVKGLGHKIWPTRADGVRPWLFMAGEHNAMGLYPHDLVYEDLDHRLQLDSKVQQLCELLARAESQSPTRAADEHYSKSSPTAAQPCGKPTAFQQQTSSPSEVSTTYRERFDCIGGPEWRGDDHADIAQLPPEVWRGDPENPHRSVDGHLSLKDVERLYEAQLRGRSLNYASVNNEMDDWLYTLAGNRKERARSIVCAGCDHVQWYSGPPNKALVLEHRQFGQDRMTWTLTLNTSSGNVITFLKHKQKYRGFPGGYVFWTLSKDAAGTSDYSSDFLMRPLSAVERDARFSTNHRPNTRRREALHKPWNLEDCDDEEPGYQFGAAFSPSNPISFRGSATAHRLKLADQMAVDHSSLSQSGSGYVSTQPASIDRITRTTLRETRVGGKRLCQSPRDSGGSNAVMANPEGDSPRKRKMAIKNVGDAVSVKGAICFRKAVKPSILVFQPDNSIRDYSSGLLADIERVVAGQEQHSQPRKVLAELKSRYGHTRNPLHFRHRFINEGKTFKGSSHYNMIAALLHMFGERRQNAAQCSACQRDAGPFEGCVTVDGLYDGTCSNHMYHFVPNRCLFSTPGDTPEVSDQDADDQHHTSTGSNSFESSPAPVDEPYHRLVRLRLHARGHEYKYTIDMTGCHSVHAFLTKITSSGPFKDIFRAPSSIAAVGVNFRDEADNIDGRTYYIDSDGGLCFGEMVDELRARAEARPGEPLRLCAVIEHAKKTGH